jgi:hypothetical protein
MEFKRGDWVEVRDNMSQEWYRRIYLTTIEGINCPICTVSECDADAFMEGKIISMTRWNYVRAVRPDLKVDDPVIVWLRGFEFTQKRKRHFSGWNEDGRIETFENGQTSWSSENHNRILTWDHYELP